MYDDYHRYQPSPINRRVYIRHEYEQPLDDVDSYDLWPRAHGLGMAGHDMPRYFPSARNSSPTLEMYPQQQQQHYLPQRPRVDSISFGHLPRRRGVGRKLPATPTQPSTLNIDSLMNCRQVEPSHGVLCGDDDAAALSAHINFPKVNRSPSRFSVSARSGPRLPDVNLDGRGRGLPSRHGGWSRSLDDPDVFEEAVLAGRGSRQLPTIGPRQLASAFGRGPTAAAGIRRELPRPGTTIGFSSASGHGYPLKRMGASAIVDSDDEDWC